MKSFFSIVQVGYGVLHDSFKLIGCTKNGIQKKDDGNPSYIHLQLWITNLVVWAETVHKAFVWNSVSDIAAWARSEKCWLPHFQGTLSNLLIFVFLSTGIIKLKNNGDFFIANEGRRPIYIDGRPVLSGNKWKLNNNSVVEVISRDPISFHSNWAVSLHSCTDGRYLFTDCWPPLRLFN